MPFFSSFHIEMLNFKRVENIFNNFDQFLVDFEQFLNFSKK